MVRLKVVLSVFVFMLGSVMAGSPGWAADALRGAPPQANAERTDPVAAGVREALEATGVANVIVTFAADGQPTHGQNAKVDLSRLRSGIATARLEVLAAGGPPEQAAGPNAFGFRLRRQFDNVPALAVTLTSERALDALARQRLVIDISLDVGGTGTLANSVPVIDADIRQAIGNDGAGVTVAIMDTGADLDHPDLMNDISTVDQACFGDNGTGGINGAGFCPNGSDRQTGLGSAEDDAGHGTHVAGIVTSTGTVSSPGVAPGAQIVPIKITDGCSFSGCFYFFSEIVAAWDWIIANNATLGIDVINMSFGTSTQYAGDCDAQFTAGAAAIATLRSIGITPFASAGNNGGTMMGAPACIAGVLSVGATDNTDAAAAFTDSNATTDMFAPGNNIMSLNNDGTTVAASGTSMASPHAAGCAALLIQAGDATTPAQIETRLETSPVTVTRNSITFPRIDCGPDNDDPPAANAGGPYSTNEGIDVALSGAASSDPEGGVLTYAWDFDGDAAFDDATGATPSFTAVGQDGVFTVRLQVTDVGGQTAAASTTVTVANVAPTVSLSAVAAVNENGAITLSGTISDPGWLDPLTATVNWDDGAGATSITGTLENGRPNATLTFSLPHTYGDNGSFVVTVCGSDDDSSTCSSTTVTVNNVNPTAVIDDSAAQPFVGGPAILVSAGVPVNFSGTSVDPGSDDLILTWNWDDGAPVADVVTTYLNSPPGTDPANSPQVNPRNVTDARSHAFGSACLYNVGFRSIDDDTGSNTDSILVLVVGNADQVRSAGYWYQQYQGGQARKSDAATLGCYLRLVGFVSSVFDEQRSASTLQTARNILAGDNAATEARFRLDRQLLAAWLNFVSGSVGLQELIDTNGDRVGDTPFITIMQAAEVVRLNPAASAADLLRYKDILDAFNNG